MCEAIRENHGNQAFGEAPSAGETDKEISKDETEWRWAQGLWGPRAGLILNPGVRTQGREEDRGRAVFTHTCNLR